MSYSCVRKAVCLLIWYDQCALEDSIPKHTVLLRAYKQHGMRHSQGSFFFSKLFR